MGLLTNFKELIFGRTIHIENLDHKSLPVETLSDDEIHNYFEIKNHVVQAKQPAIEDKFLSVPEEFDEYMKLDNLFKYSWCKKWCETSNKKLSICESENFFRRYVVSFSTSSNFQKDDQATRRSNWSTVPNSSKTSRQEPN